MYLLPCWRSGWRSAPQHRRLSAPPWHCPLSTTLLSLTLALLTSCRCFGPFTVLVPLVVVKLGLQLHVGGGLLLQPRHQLIDLRLVLCLSLAVVRDCVVQLCLLVGNLLVQNLECTLITGTFVWFLALSSHLDLPIPTRATCPSPWPGAPPAGQSLSWEYFTYIIEHYYKACKFHHECHSTVVS